MSIDLIGLLNNRKGFMGPPSYAGSMGASQPAATGLLDVPTVANAQSAAGGTPPIVVPPGGGPPSTSSPLPGANPQQPTGLTGFLDNMLVSFGGGDPNDPNDPIPREERRRMAIRRINRIGEVMAANSGPSRFPQSWGATLGQGMAAARRGVQEDEDNYGRREQQRYQTAQLRARMELRDLIANGASQEEIERKIVEAFPEQYARTVFQSSVPDPTELRRLIAERDALPPGDPRRAEYDAVIAKKGYIAPKKPSLDKLEVGDLVYYGQFDFKEDGTPAGTFTTADGQKIRVPPHRRYKPSVSVNAGGGLSATRRRNELLRNTEIEDARTWVKNNPDAVSALMKDPTGPNAEFYRQMVSKAKGRKWIELPGEPEHGAYDTAMRRLRIDTVPVEPLPFEGEEAELLGDHGFDVQVQGLGGGESPLGY